MPVLYLDSQSRASSFLQWRYDQTTATYLLLLSKKQRGKPVRLRPELTVCEDSCSPLRQRIQVTTDVPVFLPATSLQHIFPAALSISSSFPSLGFCCFPRTLYIFPPSSQTRDGLHLSEDEDIVIVKSLDFVSDYIDDCPWLSRETPKGVRSQPYATGNKDTVYESCARGLKTILSVSE